LSAPGLFGAKPVLDDPEALLLLGAFPVLLLIARRLRPTPWLEVRSLGLWKRAQREAGPYEKAAGWLRAAGAVFAACALFAAPFAAARLRFILPGGARVALLVDVSASTGARGPDGRTRLEASREEAARWLVSRPATDRFALLAAGAEPRWIVESTPDRGAVLAGLEPEDCAARPALAVAEARRAGLVPVFFTDGGEDARAVGEGVARFVAAGTCPNAGFVGLDLADDGLRPEVTVRYAVRDYDRSAGAARVEAALDGERLASDEFPLAPGRVVERSLRIPRRGGGTLELRLLPGDGFALDDAVIAEVGKGPRGPVVLTERAAQDPVLLALAGALAEEAGVPLRTGSSVAEAASLAVAADETIDPRSVGSPWLGFGTRFVGTGEARTIERPSLDRIEADSTLLAGLSIDSLMLARVAPPTGVQAIAWGDGTGLLYGASIGEARVVATAFSLEDSNFALLAAFPIFARRAFASLSGSAPAPLVRTGAPPAGVPVAAWGGGEIRKKVGPLAQGGCANFLDPAESDLSPRLPSGWTGSVPEGPGVEVDPTPTLLWAALAGLLLRLLAAGAARALEALPA